MILLFGRFDSVVIVLRTDVKLLSNVRIKFGVQHKSYTLGAIGVV